MGYLLFLWYIKKCIFLNVIVGTFYHTFKTKIKIGKICNMKIIEEKKVFYREREREKKPTRFGFQKAFPKGTSGKRGSSYIRVNTVVALQYCNTIL